MLAINKPDLVMDVPINVRNRQLRHDVSTAIGGASGFRRPFPPIHVYKPNLLHELKAEFLKISWAQVFETNRTEGWLLRSSFFFPGHHASRAGINALEEATEFSFYRPGAGEPFLLVNGEKSSLGADELERLEAALPSYHELRTDLAIPNSVSIAELAGQPHSQLHLRKTRTEILEQLGSLAPLTAEAAGAAILPALTEGTDPASVEAEVKRKAEFELARQLLIDAAGIDRQAFTELQEAITSGREGQVEAIIGAMNSAIKENLNVQRWWSQDRDFELLVEAREHELAFTILDRTGSKYSFGERSQGLRFFLSYFVQLTAHRLTNGKPDILLLDEPDAFLSSVGQQDLLRVLHDYALPEDDGQQSQVVYVTHSPFLIDKNAPHRIRVLDKGSEDEGTRVVRDAANNRYEPLRSSIGTNLAETTFIGGKNLFVEGPGDQILLAGISAHIAKREQSTSGVLDLNEVTVVACGGARHEEARSQEVDERTRLRSRRLAGRGCDPPAAIKYRPRLRTRGPQHQQRASL